MHSVWDCHPSYLTSCLWNKLLGVLLHTSFNSPEQTEIQRLFLLESLEMETVRRQRTLVREQNIHYWYLAENKAQEGRGQCYVRQRNVLIMALVEVSQLEVILKRKEWVTAWNLAGIKILNSGRNLPQTQKLRFLTTVSLIISSKLDPADYHFSWKHSQNLLVSLARDWKRPLSFFWT